MTEDAVTRNAAAENITGRNAAAQDTVWALEPHTEAKHRIYDGYLDAWYPIILQTFKSGTYAEGFAGPGVYEQGQPGSPVRALRRLVEARRTHAHIRYWPARMVLVEKRADRAAELLSHLRAELNHPMPDGEYHDATLHIVVRRGTCETDLPALLTKVGAWEAPVLAVLDSFGGGSTQQLIERFANLTGGEVLVTVEPQHFVRRLDLDRGDRVFGNQDWRAVDELPAGRKRTFIANCLIDSIRNAGFEFVISFGLESGGTDLLLQFGTNHPTGLARFKKSLWDADPVSGTRFRDPNDPDQMLLDLGHEPNLAPLRRLILGHLNGLPGRVATVGELRTFTEHHTMFRALHVPLALDGLRARCEIVTSPAQRKIGRHTRPTVRVFIDPAGESRLF